MLKYFDSHCHPQNAAYDGDREEVLARMKENDVAGLVVGTDISESRKAVELAQTHDFLWAAIGLHPNDNETEEFAVENFEELSKDFRVVAIGECGLDYYRNQPTAEEKERQHERFLQHVALAKKCGKPLMIHCRPTRKTQNANEEMIEILQKERVPAIMHFFTATPEIAEKYLALGCYLSFPGVLTFTDMYDDVVRRTPLERMLSETDSPFAAPTPFRGKRNEPMHVREVVKRIAEIKKNSTAETADQLYANAKTVFGI